MNVYKRLIAFVLVFSLTAGAFLYPHAGARADGPESVYINRNSTVYAIEKNVREITTEKGTTEVWELIGIFGNPEDAQKSVETIKEEITIPGAAEDTQEPTEMVTDETNALVNSDEPKIPTAKKKNNNTVLIEGYRFIVTRTPVEDEGVMEEKPAKKKIWGKSRRRKLKEIQDKTIPYNQIYIQDNRGSGR